MKFLLSLTMLIGCLAACDTVKNSTPSPVGFIKLNNYAVNQNLSLPDEFNYKFITQDADFHRAFYMTKATPETAVVPDFNSQSVVAVVMKPTEKVVTLDFIKAEVAGKNMNVYYSVVDTTSWKSFLSTPHIVATVPRVIDVKHVSFYANNQKMKTVEVQ